MYIPQSHCSCCFVCSWIAPQAYRQHTRIILSLCIKATDKRQSGETNSTFSVNTENSDLKWRRHASSRSLKLKIIIYQWGSNMEFHLYWWFSFTIEKQSWHTAQPWFRHHGSTYTRTHFGTMLDMKRSNNIVPMWLCAAGESAYDSEITRFISPCIYLQSLVVGHWGI